jgi:hypothetical protein
MRSEYGDTGGLRRPGAPRASRRARETAEVAEEFVYTPETKEFFRTSEFLLWLLTVLAIFIASGVNEEFDSRSAWTVVTAVTTGYIVSRGIAKAGTGRGWNDQLWAEGPVAGSSFASGTSGPQDTAEYGTRTRTVTGGEPVERLIEEVRTPETKEFFRSSEFLMWLLGTIGVLIASAYEQNFGASSAWMLVTVLSAGYILSRGLAKAGTARGYDPRTGRYGALSVASTPETKESFRTSELAVMLLTVLGILLASGADPGFDAPGAWRMVAGMVTAYMISRGIAKMGAAQAPVDVRSRIA